MQISRSDLYRLVSGAPLSKVAPELGISSASLASICRANDVPYPGSGYWTRKLLGQPVELPPLPPADGEIMIVIEPSAPRPRARRLEAGGARVGQDESVPVQITVSEHARPLHPIVRKRVDEHARRRKETLNSRDSWAIRMAPPPFTEIDHRRHRILDALLQALEARGAKLSEAEKGLIRATIDGEAIEFQIREKARQARVPKEDPRSSYLSQELVGTGRLVFAIRTYLRGPHNEEWLENDRKSLESQLPQIVERLFEGSRILKAWHIEQEEERERWRREAARREELVRLARQQQAFRGKLAEVAENVRVAGEIRNLLAQARSKAFDEGKEVCGKTLRDWFDWAEAAADALDATKLGAEGIFDMIGRTKVETR